MVDDAHARRRARPGRARLGRRGRARRRGRRPGRDARQGTRQLRRLRLLSRRVRDATRQHRPAADLLDGPAARRRSPPRGAALEIVDRAAGPDRTPARATPRPCARRSPPTGFDPGGAGAQIIPLVVGDPDRAVRDLPARPRRAASSRRRSARRRSPTGTSRLRLTVDGDHTRRARREAAHVAGRRPLRAALVVDRRPSRCRSSAGWRASTRRGASATASAEAAVRAAAPHARRLRDRHRHRGRQDRRRRGIAAARRGAGERVARLQAGRLGARRAGGRPPDHELLARAAGSGQSADEIAPYRFGPPVSPHLAAELAGEEIDPDAARAARRRPRPASRRARRARASAD